MSAPESIYGPTWYAETSVPAREREPLLRDRDVDVCIVGGGLAGLTIAREVARRGWSVIVLEAKRIAWNASGRNAGFVGPGFAERPERIVERIGYDRAKALWALSAMGVEYVRNTMRETEMPGVRPVGGWLSVQRVDDEPRMAARGALLADFGTTCELWNVDRVRTVLKSQRYYQALHDPSAFHIHALNYAFGLADAAEEAGAALFESTPALAIDPTGVRKVIETPKARVRANHIVLAASAHLAPLLPLISEAVMPIATYVATTGPIANLAEAIAYPGAIADNRRAGDYYRIVDGARLMWGGRISARLETPKALAQMLREDMSKVFPQLAGTEIRHAWSGTMGYAVHKMPQIGQVIPGLWVSTAFGGHGLNTTAMAGQLIASAIVEGDDRWRLFSSYDLVWAGRAAGNKVAQAVYWSMQVWDTLDERLARHRDKIRRRAEAISANRAAAEAVRRAVDEAARSTSGTGPDRLAAQKARVISEAEERKVAAAAAQAAAEEAEWRAAEAAAGAAPSASQDAEVAPLATTAWRVIEPTATSSVRKPAIRSESAQDAAALEADPTANGIADVPPGEGSVKGAILRALGMRKPPERSGSPDLSEDPSKKE